jgi:hypothetical protein
VVVVDHAAREVRLQKNKTDRKPNYFHSTLY